MDSSEKRQNQRRWLLPGLVTVAILAYLATGFFTVAQDERGVVVRFGMVSRTVEPGLHYRFPWPVGEVLRVKTTVYPMSVGYKIRDELRGIPPEEREMQWLTGDTNLIDIRLDIQYKIYKPKDFLFQTEEPRFLVRRAAEGVLTELIGRTPVDGLLTYGKTQLVQEVERLVQQRLDKYRAGVLIVSLNAVGLDPPSQVVDDFNDVKRAQREQDRAIIEANGYRDNLMAQTQGEKIKIRNDAEARYQERVDQAAAETNRFINLLEEYQQNPDAVKIRLYNETMSKLLPRLNITLYPSGTGIAPRIQVMQGGTGGRP